VVLLNMAKPLVGVVAGWTLSYWQSRRRERRIERNIRALLRIEIDENIAALRDYDESVRRAIETHPLQAKHMTLLRY
jgi:hypothetical protein